MKTIPFYASKLVWQNVIMMLIGVVQVFMAQGSKPIFDYTGALTIVFGVLGVIWRIWFTSTNIASTPSVPPTVPPAP